MAFGTPTFHHGAIPKINAGNTTMVSNFLERIVGVITSYQSNGEQAWEVADAINTTPTSYDVVFHSVGDRSLGSGSNKGDADIWMRIKRTSTTRIKISYMLDYSPTSHTAKWERPTSTTYYICNISNDNYPIEYWMVVNEYQITIVHRRVGVSQSTELFLGGQLKRAYAESVNGVARLTSQSGTGNGVVVGLDRDITNNITVGQKVWIVEQTPDGQALTGTNPDANITVTAISANSITLDGVGQSYSNGSLVGLDPSPMGSVAQAGRTPYRSTFQTIVDLWGGTAGWSGSSAQSMQECQPLDSDPDANGLWPMGMLWVRDGPSSRRGFRGYWAFVRVISKTGSLINTRDVIEADWDEGQRFKYFEDTYLLYIAGDWTVCLGPGAPEY